MTLEIGAARAGFLDAVCKPLRAFRGNLRRFGSAASRTAFAFEAFFELTDKSLTVCQNHLGKRYAQCSDVQSLSVAIITHMNPSQNPENVSASAKGQSSSSTKAAVLESARQTASQIKDAASATAHRAAETVQQTASETKAQAADRVEAYGSAIHDSAKSLEEKDPNIAWVTHQAADRLQRVANYVRERDFQGFRQDAENLARRHPIAFFGGMALAGLILGNVIKATGKAVADSSDDDEYGPDFGKEPGQDYAPASSELASSAEI